MGVPRPQPHGFQFSPDSDELAPERMCWEILTLVTRGARFGKRQVAGGRQTGFGCSSRTDGCEA